ncbi:hypothetical protein FACS189472_03560 [Alphaproteobacteria bacterium]|nr:hypothetical protein FACS189472_03560 [Alphaproteobacteria bacterium]
MRIIIIGEKLEDHLFKLVRLSDELGCGSHYFKRNCDLILEESDIVVIDSRLVDQLSSDTQSHVVSVTFNTNYKRTFLNETIVGFGQMSEIHIIVEKIAEDLIWPIVSDSSTINIFQLAKKIASTNATILITGETGTGKEVVAKYIHGKSDRANKNFVAINCAAIPDQLLESELFGHEKGAFTNALQKRIGKFQEANFGTILLDEISEMSLSLQAKLLRVIQEREITPLGSNSLVKLDVRIIATSNRNLKQAVLRGTFREDLFYRLNVININMPKLSDREGDIIPLAKFFCRKYSGGKKTLSVSAQQFLHFEKWNGNIRELENVVQRSVLLSPRSVLSREDIILDTVIADVSNENLHEPKTLEQMEKEVILETLEKFKGRKKRVAESLGISIKTLRNKINQYEPF